MIRFIAALLFLLLFMSGTSSAQWRAFEVFENGTYQNRITILLLSEGYTESELEVFRQDVLKVTDDIFNVSPFKEYKNYFRVVAVEVPSNESGASSIFDGDVRDTYFKSTFGQGGGRDLSLMFPVGTGRLYDIKTALDLGWWNSITMVMVNDHRLGGGPEIATRGGQEFEVVVHEIGHQFGRLADEYEESGRTPIPGPNVTQITDRNHIPWKHWILPDTPIPTPVEIENFDKIGLFEGAAYQSNGWFRSQLSCRMRYNTDHFCAVCNEQLIGRMYTEFNSGRILTVSPEVGQINLSLHEQHLFNYTGPTPENGLVFEWFLNESLISNNAEFDVIASELGIGDHVLELRIHDRNTQVLDAEISGRMSISKNWEISVTESTSNPPVVHFSSDVALGMAYPNPANNNAMITFRLPESQIVELAVYDLAGRKVSLITQGVYPIGEHRINWMTSQLSSGMYIVTLQTSHIKLSRTLMILR